MSATVIRSCLCTNTGQDELHGKNKRVMNQAGAKGALKYRCTVCGREYSAGGTEKK